MRRPAPSPKDGLSGLKARALADEAGCAVGAIYNVVADLDELVLLANARTLAALEKALAAAASPGHGPDWAIEQLVKLALAYLEFAASHRKQWQALFEHRLASGQNPPEWYQRELERLFEYVERPVEELQPDTTPDAAGAAGALAVLCRAWARRAWARGKASVHSAAGAARAGDDHRHRAGLGPRRRRVTPVPNRVMPHAQP